MSDAATPAYSSDVMAYMARVYDEGVREFACRAETPESVAEWQSSARPALRKLIGLEVIAESAGGHTPTAELGEPEDCGELVRQGGRLETEPNVWVPFWIVRPKGEGPFPLAVTPHGHDRRGYDTSVGIAADDAARAKLLAEDRDVAIQAAREGYLAIAPATRGIGCDGVPDIHGRHGERDCRSQAMHCLLAGRTPTGERAWDMSRFIDWALAELPVHDRDLLMLGNSGGGMVSTYAPACDARVRIAIASCSFNGYVASTGKVVHCDCNIVPGILRFGGFHDVAGLIAPRHLLMVHGRDDPLFDNDDVDRAVSEVRRIYAAASAAERFEHAYGAGGHRFYGELMWPFVRRARGKEQ
jgi:dienelactone hydrolase